MINVSMGEIVVNLKGPALSKAVRAALDESATALLQLYAAEDVDLASITTKTNVRLAYVKYVRLCTLAKRGAKFDATYVREAFSAYSARHLPLSEAAFYRLTLAEPGSQHGYRPTYRTTVQFSLGFFLIALHGSGAVTLPYSFNWPLPKRYGEARVEIAPFIGSELIKFIRSIGDEDSPHAAAFESVMTHDRRRSWFLSNGTKVLLALGWNRPEDANLDDMLKLKEANDATDFSRCGRAMGYRALIDVLERRYGSKVAISVRAWNDALRTVEHRADKTRRLLSGQEQGEGTVEVYSMLPSDAFPERLDRVNSLPGLTADFPAMRKTWLSLQITYLRKLRRESTKEHYRCIGYLNLYLFFYLPYWFDEHLETPLKFPSKPTELLAGIFVSRLVNQEFAVPLTYIEFLERYGDQHEWAPTSRYIALKSLEQFFDFLERNSKELPGCRGFIQPLAKHDFPMLARSGGTNKRPVPRRLFAFYVAYVEALVNYTSIVLEQIIEGNISSDDIGIFAPKRHIIDTLQAAKIVGYVPMVFFRGKAHRLEVIPNCMDLATFKLKDGRSLRIPKPHGLNHVLVAIYTGLRNQHIQWLDARTFDSHVNPDDSEITKLLVNTDKVKNKSWMPHVNIRVIEVLRLQLRWRNLIDQRSFDAEVYYEGNRKTKWPAIQPLFAVDEDGYPHHDRRYEDAWRSILMGVQGMLSEIECGHIAPLFDLLPTDVPYDATDRRALLQRHRDSSARVVHLVPKSNITPHSARVGVVSHLITVLPAELIGKYVTGQHTSVVYHYVYIDEDDVRAAREEQAVSLQVRAYGREFDSMMTSPTRPNPQFVRADGVNSNFARAMQKDMDATLASYGCVTLSLREDGKNGIDVLRETRGANSAYNRTELCPFGNQCPPDVLKDLRGIGCCGMCPYAVRSVDHLPAVVAKIKQFAEHLQALEEQLDADDADERLSEAEQQQLEAGRQRLGDELAGWKLASEVLEEQRRRIHSGRDTRRWVVGKPEVIAKELQRLPVPSNDVAYVLARLAESVAYPTCDSPEIKARFDLLRRQLLANVGRIREALTSVQPPDVAAQCAGLLRSVVDSQGLDYGRVVKLLTTDAHLQALPESQPPLLLEST